MNPTNKAREALESLISFALMRYGHGKQNRGESGKPGFIVSRLKETEAGKALIGLKSKDIAEVSPELIGDDHDTAQVKEFCKKLTEFDRKISNGRRRGRYKI